MRISDWSSDVCSSDLAFPHPAEVHAYATRIVIRQGNDIVAEHARRYGRDQTIYDPWHYVPVLAKKPGALRNGAPFKQLALPPGLERLRTRLKERSDGDRPMVKILTALTVDGPDAVEGTAAAPRADGVARASLLLKTTARARPPPRAPPT